MLSVLSCNKNNLAHISNKKLEKEKNNIANKDEINNNTSNAQFSVYTKVSGLVNGVLDRLYTDVHNGIYDKKVYDDLFNKTYSELSDNGIKLSGVQSTVMQKVFKALGTGISKTGKEYDRSTSLKFIKDTLENYLKTSNSIYEQHDAIYASAIFESIVRYSIENNEKIEGNPQLNCQC